MSCMNCNRETVGTDVFCEQCQQAMEPFPVPKGTPIVIPQRIPPSAPKKQPTRRYASSDEQSAIAQRRIRRLAGGLIITSILCILAILALTYVVLFGVPDFLSNLTAPTLIT